MNRTIRRTAVFTLLLVLALLVRATWVQFYESQALADDQLNRRNAIETYSDPLGNIIVAGKSVTGSARTSGDLKYKRTYTNGKLYAAVTGYASQAYAPTQLEGIYADVLNGTDTRLKTVMDTVTDQRAAPGNVITTIDPAVQKAAYDALGDNKGAAVAVDPKTGRILAVVSTPSYDPSTLTDANTAGSAWKSLNADADKPLVNRALRQPLPPGSTFKLVVAAAALEDGLYDNVDARTDSENPYTLPGTRQVLANENASAPCTNASIRVALQYSCNNVFAHMAVQLGQDKVRAMAEKFGFNNEAQDVPVRPYASVYPKGMDPAQTGLTGIGQFDVTATPLQMAMVSAAIANGGKLVSPHMVSQVTNSGGDVLEDVDGETTTRQVVSSGTAEQLQSAMQTVVQDGTGTNARISGATVGGKTGTAQHGENNSKTPYAWFTSYAKAGGKEVAVAVMVEQSDAARSEVSGNGLAAPVAKAMMEAAVKN
ncbi:peptidoglycan D,D-transpeptidase FtsI family protein [Streptomyces acidiscabies]|uniref:Penicillin-binding transpeptidase domain-containing protein n=1 Tax=Streptomyces acidiscabies TaxID=42234 RepID=A0AAP6B669_9ACTN|nr:penicillin-binding transpeptidase domain-containing protein [Streptomyces acidiscabies]MBP5940435.1 penicillin-binding protein 2 [Streptomyces sp. LBUM 1476]MBZ3911676.1 penicillin-binding protein 2 [Streptomyces acidiscabies]MDX2958901.1 penicillin-binding transpeptidase domain-containing protein [Streptomyces acidiscabies]MDX3018338.1 penicillin-binding transpeptidase domain-containing protein [Streptomyces acidiscabies]MDX3794709.1 penicillin-binding transpeptidase domain-containing prot